MDALDTHYTPSPVARALLAAIHDIQPSLIADLAAGEGDLLLEAERLWPAATFIATDIDRRALRRLARLRPSWTFGRCDLYNPRSRATCRALKQLLNSPCLMLLNPPFSCRGGTRFLVQTPDGPLHASTAMSFLLLAASYVLDGGHIVSILPLGSIYNVKDTSAWHYLHSRYSVNLIHKYTTAAFPNSAANTAIVRLSPPTQGSPAVWPQPTATPIPPSLSVNLIRGSCPAHRHNDDNEKPILVHYTDIRNGSVALNGRHGFGSFPCVTGPAILIPRVGQLTSGKIAILHSPHPVMLSDCVIALKPPTLQATRDLRDRLLSRLAQLKTHYTGTGAPFVTVARLTAALAAIGVNVD